MEFNRGLGVEMGLDVVEIVELIELIVLIVLIELVVDAKGPKFNMMFHYGVSIYITCRCGCRRC